MIFEKKVLAIIPARGGSKGLPRKNITMLLNKPLISWPIKAALNSKFIDKVIVSTEDKEISEIAEKFGAEIPFIRPKSLASDNSSSYQVIDHALEFFEKRNEKYDYLVFLEPTSPLTQSQDIDSAISILDSKRNIADSIVSVCKTESTHPSFLSRINKKGTLVPFESDFSPGLRRQELDNIYFFDGSLYISDVRVIKLKKSFYHSRTLPYIVPRWKSYEIDEYMDLVIIEAILKNLEKINKD